MRLWVHACTHRYALVCACVCVYRYMYMHVYIRGPVARIWHVFMFRSALLMNDQYRNYHLTNYSMLMAQTLVSNSWFSFKLKRLVRFPKLYMTRRQPHIRYIPQMRSSWGSGRFGCCDLPGIRPAAGRPADLPAPVLDCLGNSDTGLKLVLCEQAELDLSQN